MTRDWHSLGRFFFPVTIVILGQYSFTEELQLFVDFALRRVLRLLSTQAL